LSRRRQSSIPNRNEKRRTTNPYSTPPVLKTHQICWRKFLAFICPCLSNINNKTNQTLEQEQQQQNQPRLSIEPINQQNEISPIIQSNLIYDDDPDGIISPLLIENHPRKNLVDNDGLTCDTVIVKNENEDYDDELLSDENDVTIQQTSIISNHSPLLTHNNNNNQDYRFRSKSDGHTLKELALKCTADNKSLR
jgi:hypothetical protein